MARREFPKSVKVAAVKRATKNGEVYCEQCGVLCKSKWEIDHVIPDGLGGEPTLANAKVICRECHTEKTKGDVGKIAKAKRCEARSLGVRKTTPRINSPGFVRVDRNRPITTKIVPRRAMFEEI
jgi:5-methylcytosine-specific restriction endonuclease McrA